MADAASPPAPTIDIRQRVQAQASRLRRVKLVDRLAVGFITFGGLLIIVAVLFIFVFIFGESLPLFRPASGAAKGTVSLAAVPPLEYTPAAAPATVVLSEPGKPLVMGTDEYQRYFYEVLADGRTAFWTSDGAFSRQL